MALGDAVTVIPTSVNAAASLTIRPASGEEWIIHNIEGAVGFPLELYKTDGSNSILFDSNLTGGFLGYPLHVTYTVYFTVKNTDVSARFISYDGIVSKVAT